MKLSQIIATVMLAGGLSVCNASMAQDTGAILDKAIKALGGEEAIGKVKMASWKSKGTISVQGNDNEVTSTYVLQDLTHFRQEFEGDFGGQKVKGITIVNGDKGFRSFNDMRTDFDAEQLVAAKRNVYIAVLPVTIIALKSKDYKVEAVGEEAVSGKPAIGIKVTCLDKKDFKIFFDKESGLPVKVVAKVAGFQGDEVNQETVYSDYKEMAGIKKATKVVSIRNGEKFSEQVVTEFKALTKVDPKSLTEP